MRYGSNRIIVVAVVVGERRIVAVCRVWGLGFRV